MAIPRAEGKAGGYIRAASLSTAMFVVRLRSGGLLLYSPVHIHPGSTLAALLATLGPVEWLVVASSAHTLQVSTVTATFPTAMVVGHRDAEMKLLAASDAALPRGQLDYDISITQEDR